VTASTLVAVFLSSESDVTMAVATQKRGVTTLMDADQPTEWLQTEASVLQLCSYAPTQLYNCIYYAVIMQVRNTECTVPLVPTQVQRSRNKS
jgi:hypothetical protein